MFKVQVKEEHGKLKNLSSGLFSIWAVFFLPVFLQPGNGCVAQLNRASDYGSEGFRFES
jgi:hypothetical protein